MSNWRKVEEVITYYGKGVTPKYVDNSQIIVLNQKCIRDNKIDYSFAQFIDDTKSYNENKFLKVGDILVNSTGQGTAGRVALVNTIPDGYKIIVDSHILVLRTKNYYESKCLNYSLFSIEKTLQTYIDGSTGQGEFDKVRLFNVQVNYPNDLPTQQKIAAVLSALDDKIELNNTINAELEAMAKTLYDYWFVQFEFPNAEGKPYKSSGGAMEYNTILKRELPKGWEVKRLEDITEVKDGTHDSPKYISENGYPLVTSKNLKKSGIDFSETNKITKIDFDLINQRSQVHTGDILFSMIGNIGTIYKVEEKEIGFAIKNVALFKTSNNLGLKNFIFQYLHSYDMQRYLPNVISGSIQKFVALGSLRNIPILFNEILIEKFTKESKPIFDKLTNNLKQNQELAALRDWLLPMLMNGQVKVS